MPSKQRFDDRLQTQVGLAVTSNALVVSPISWKQRLAVQSESSLIRWHRLDKISEVISSDRFKVKHGNCVLIEATSVHIGVATDRGTLIVFDYHQAIEFVVSGDADVTCMAFSADSTWIAAGYSLGKINVWHLLHFSPSSTSNASAGVVAMVSSNSMHHIPGHECLVLSVSFCGSHNLQLFLAGSNGDILYHFEIKLVLKKQFVLQKVMGPTPGIQRCLLLPLGSSEQFTDQTGLFAIMTANSLVVFTLLLLDNLHSTRIETQFKTKSNSGLGSTSSMAWFPCMKKDTIETGGINGKVLQERVDLDHGKDSNRRRKKTSKSNVENSKLAYSWGNQLMILEIQNDSIPPNFMEILSSLREKDKSIPLLGVIKTAELQLEDLNTTILNIKWLSSSILILVTLKKQLLTVHYHASDKKLQILGVDHLDSRLLTSIRGKLLAVSDDVIEVGSTANWADVLMELVSSGKHYEALKTAMRYYITADENLIVVVDLPKSESKRKELLKPHVLSVMKNSLSKIFSEQVSESINLELGSIDSTTLAYDKQVEDIIELYCDILCEIREDVVEILEAVFDILPSSAQKTFFDTIEPYLLSGKIKVLSPSILKELVTKYIADGRGESLTEILCVLDLKSLDIDFTIQLCKKHNLNDVLVYIWNFLLQDYETPLVDFLRAIKLGQSDDLSIFTYMSYLLTGKQFPTDRYMDAESSKLARDTICKFLFSNSVIILQDGSPVNTTDDSAIFPYLVMLLNLNSFELLLTLNEFFEDVSLNDELGKLINRQYIIEALLDTFEVNEFTEETGTQLGIFIARNYPKYSQFIRLPESVLERVLDQLCENHGDLDSELALQSLLSEYEPDIDTILIGKLKSAGFYDVLIAIYRFNRNWAKILESWLLKMQMLHENQTKQNEDKVYDSLQRILEECFEHTDDRWLLISMLKSHFQDLVKIDVRSLVTMVQKYYPEFHLQAMDLPYPLDLKYLQLLFEIVEDVSQIDSKLIFKNITLLKAHDQKELVIFVTKVASLKLHCEPYLEDDVECLNIVLGAKAKYKEALSLIVKRLKSLEVETDAKTIARLFELAMKNCEAQDYLEETGFDGELYLHERLWLQLIDTSIIMANRLHSWQSEHLNVLLQHCFRKVGNGGSKIHGKSGEERTVLVIFNKFLERMTLEGNDSDAEASATLSNIRSILQELFVSYSYESEMIKICLLLIHEGIHHNMKVVRSKLLEGLMPTNNSCASCGKPLWMTINDDHWLAWEDRQSGVTNVMLLEKYGHCRLVFFACGHGYHGSCLQGIGGDLVCVLEN